MSALTRKVITLLRRIGKNNPEGIVVMEVKARFCRSVMTPGAFNPEKKSSIGAHGGGRHMGAAAQAVMEAARLTTREGGAWRIGAAMTC